MISYNLVLLFEFLLVGFFASLIVTYPYYLKLRRQKLVKTFITYFHYLEDKYNAKFPIVMKSINSDFPEIMPSDIDNACIFFCDEYLIITKIKDHNFEYIIPKNSITDVYYEYSSKAEAYDIAFKFIKDNNMFTLMFRSEPFFCLTNKFIKKHFYYLDSERFIKELLSIQSK